MSVLGCIEECFDVKVPQRYDKANCGNKLRSYGYDSALLFHCSLLSVFVENYPDPVKGFDITNPEHWEWAVANDLISRTPCGNFNVGTATDEVAGVDGCGNDIIDYSEVPFTYETFQTADDYSDEDYFFLLDKKWDEYTMGWLGCDGRVHLNEDVTSQVLDDQQTIVSSGRLGYTTSKSARPQFVENNGPGKAGKWTMAGTFKTGCVSRGLTVPGLIDALNNA